LQLDGRRRDSVEEEAGPTERDPLQRRPRGGAGRGGGGHAVQCGAEVGGGSAAR
jgi:hypothetical protein